MSDDKRTRITIDPENDTQPPGKPRLPTFEVDRQELAESHERAIVLVAQRDLVAASVRFTDAASQALIALVEMERAREQISAASIAEANAYNHPLWDHLHNTFLMGVQQQQMGVSEQECTEVGSLLARARVSSRDSYAFLRSAIEIMHRLMAREITECASELAPLPIETDQALMDRAMRDEGLTNTQIAERIASGQHDPETYRKRAYRRDKAVRDLLEPYERGMRSLIETEVAAAVQKHGPDTEAAKKLRRLADDFLDPDKTLVAQLARGTFILREMGFQAAMVVPHDLVDEVLRLGGKAVAVVEPNRLI